MKFCGKCGAELKDDAKFCASCGEPCNIIPKASAAKEAKRKCKMPIIGMIGHTVTSKYNDDGKICEQSMQLNGESRYRYFLDYNEHGHLCNQIMYNGDNVEPSNTLEVEYTYDSEGRITHIYLEEDGRSASGIFQGSDTYRTLSLEGKASNYGDMTIVLEYDDAGNLVKQTQYVNGILQCETLYSYISLKLPLNYEQPNTNNPVYLIN